MSRCMYVYMCSIIYIYIYRLNLPFGDGEYCPQKKVVTLQGRTSYSKQGLRGFEASTPRIVAGGQPDLRPTQENQRQPEAIRKYQSNGYFLGLYGL